MTVDGFDLSTLGVRVESPGIGSIGADVATAVVPGRYGAYCLGEPQERPRQIDVVATISVPTTSTADMTLLRSRLDQLHWRLARESVQLAFPDEPTWYYVATLSNPDVIRIPPAYTQRVRRLRLSFICPDPLAYAVTPRNLSASGTPVQTPLGTARSWPVITVATPGSSLSLIYRDHAGVERGRLSLEQIPAGPVVVDMGRQEITAGGQEAAATLVHESDFWALDPVHASSLSGPWPTVATSGPTASVVYREARR